MNVLLENPVKLFGLLSAVFLGCIFGALLTETYVLALIPFALMVGFISLLDISKLYYLLILVIPLTIEIYLPNGLGIDLPGEPILIAITALSPFLLLLKFRKSATAYINHPVTIALLFHLMWILIAAVFAEEKVVGLKFLVAKIWYVVPFYFVSLYIFKTKQNYRAFFWTLMIPLAITIIYVLIKHASVDFAFSEVNYSVSPIYRNHVNYGLLMVAFIPYVWAFYHWYERGTVERLILLGLGTMMLVAIYFTYTRAAQAAVLLGVVCYFIIRFRWLISLVLAGSIVVVLLGVFFVNGSRYLDFAPQYERTITHTNYDNLIEATVKLEDISTMERVNRWVAGGHMIHERPWTGFGPGNFYFNYRNYMVSSFVTYVSDNPDKSGIHNYYLMTLVEQGIPGLLVFLGLLITILIYGQRVYHQLEDRELKLLVMAATISIMLIAITIFINDLLEALKIGGLFFIGVAIIVREGVRAGSVRTT
ncbi:O-antigen ligase family protein [Portibacter marinus]|uniref:O-antigen ligase family protein n=1 Tax=Portibacter marinus TaxID=2898660 RepID=UPI001F400B10|nr:O-antigen ligase family protein [Portibacter marinus]